MSSSDDRKRLIERALNAWLEKRSECLVGVATVTEFRQWMSAAVDALVDALIPLGHKVLPREPTRKMIDEMASAYPALAYPDQDHTIQGRSLDPNYEPYIDLWHLGCDAYEAPK